MVCTWCLHGAVSVGKHTRIWPTSIATKRRQILKSCYMQVDATASGAKSIKIFSPDNDVFVLALRRCPELCADTSFFTGRGQRHRNIQLCPIVRALGAARTAALPGFHAWSGADVTGNFAFKGKLECWKAFL